MLYVNIVCHQIAGVSKGSQLTLSGGQALLTPLNQSFKKQIYKGSVEHVDSEQVYLQFSEQ